MEQISLKGNVIDKGNGRELIRKRNNKFSNRFAVTTAQLIRHKASASLTALVEHFRGEISNRRESDM